MLMFFYYLARISGFLFIDVHINAFGKVTTKKSFWNIVVFVFSFGFSAFASSYDDDIAIAEIMHSKMMEIGVNFVVKFMLWITCCVKLVSAFLNRKYFCIIANLQWNFMEVSEIKDINYPRYVNFFLSA